MSLGPLYVLSSLKKCLFSSFALFLIGLCVFLEWSCVSSLYVIEIKPLSKVSFANMFSHAAGSLVILLMLSWAVQKPFYFDEVPCVYSFLYVPCSRGHVYQWKYCCMEYLRFSCLCSLGLLWFISWHLSLLSILSLVLNMMFFWFLK